MTRARTAPRTAPHRAPRTPHRRNLSSHRGYSPRAIQAVVSSAHTHIRAFRSAVGNGSQWSTFPHGVAIKQLPPAPCRDRQEGSLIEGRRAPPDMPGSLLLETSARSVDTQGARGGVGCRSARLRPSSVPQSSRRTEAGGNVTPTAGPSVTSPLHTPHSRSWRVRVGLALGPPPIPAAGPLVPRELSTVAVERPEVRGPPDGGPW